jgi:hypothetical protein
METNHHCLLTMLISAIVMIVAAVFFLHRNVPSLQFFHKEKLYDFKDAFIFLQWYHGPDSENYSYLVKFPDETYFRIVFHNTGEPDVEEYSKEQMIKRLQDEVKSFPKEALAALKLIGV